MATERLPDYDELLRELVDLERRERAVSAARRKLHERLERFPSDFASERERQISQERRELHERIDKLKAELAVFMPVARRVTPLD